MDGFYFATRAPLVLAMSRTLLLFLALVLPFTACERKLTEAETLEKEVAEKREAGKLATPTPPPKPGDWMWKKDRKTPLDEKPK